MPLRMAKEHGVKFIRLWFTDVLGEANVVGIAMPSNTQRMVNAQALSA